MRLIELHTIVAGVAVADVCLVDLHLRFDGEVSIKNDGCLGIDPLVN
jgi:hypothetical protein